MDKNNIKILEREKILDYLVAIVILLIFGTTFLISIKSQLNSHPDEKDHFDAVEYYTKHFMPPKLTSEEIASTYTQYGESRLTELDIYYFIVGKFSNILNLIFNNKVITARLFNLILLAIILSLLYKLYKKDNYLFIPFLLTSQIWYLFSYINNDAWAVFLNMIFIYQLFYKESIFNFLIDSSSEKLKENKLLTGISFIALGMLFYLLSTAKLNYLVSFGISALIFFIVNYKKILKKENLYKVGVIILIGAILLGIRFLIDFKINGLDRINNTEEIRISRADEDYKPPYTLEGFKLKEQGKPISVIFTNPSYYSQTIKSFFGLYGYMNKLSPVIFYIITSLNFIIFISYVVKNNLNDNEALRIAPLILLLFGWLVLISFSVYRSYTYDYQAQGRYLLPIIPIICALMYNIKKDKKLELFIILASLVLIIMYVIYGYCAF